MVFRMYRTFSVFLKCTIQGGPKVDVLLFAFLYLWLKFWEGIDKYCNLPVRKLFYFHHWSRPTVCWPLAYHMARVWANVSHQWLVTS